MAPIVERVLELTNEVATYLQANILVNALDFWNLEHERNNFELHVCREGSRITGHLSIFHAPEGDYTSVSSMAPQATEALRDMIPKKCVLILEPSLYESIKNVIESHVTYLDEKMVVIRGQETLINSDLAVRLSDADASQYLRFGTNFNAPPVPLEWVQERLQRDIIFGVLSEGLLASVASVVARLPGITVIMSVETLQEFRGLGYATAVCSAATREGLKYSEACMLLVRSDNSIATHIYEKLGYRKMGEELWIDIGTGLIP